MKRQIGFALIYLLLIGVCCVQSSRATDRSRIEFIEDSLYKELDAMPRDSAYLAKITGIELLLMDSPRLLYYAELKEKEARKQNLMRFVCESYSDRAIYYANTNKIDSFYHWKRVMDPLALEIEEYNYYFFLCDLEVSILIEQSKIETAIQTAKEMYNTAKKYDSRDGLIASSMSMGNAFFHARRYKEAMEAYQKSLSLIPVDGLRWNSWKLSIISGLLRCCNLSGDYTKGLEFANQKQEQMDQIQQSKVGADTKLPFLIEQWVDLQLKRAHFYIKLNQPSNALERLNDVKRYYPHLLKNDQMKLHAAMSEYYTAVRDYKQAMSEMNICYLYFVDRDAQTRLEVTERKAELLGHLGHPEKAIELYQDLLLLKDSIGDAWFGSQLSELRTIYETDHLKLVNSELELQSKHYQLRMALIFCILAILAFAFISMLYIRLARVKKELEYSQQALMKERDNLVESKENLRIAKEKAEEARDLAQKAERKESFFANMSHEIRTPLNAIVGFSNLLVSGEEISTEEQELFISTINQNCDQLLKLVNDVLDLSRMESDKMQFSIGQFDLTEIVSQVYSTHRMLIPQGLEFVKEVPEQPLSAYVDKGRLKQVLSNFINNATKFTAEGHIKVGYERRENGIALFVEDTGRGIPEAHQKKIFERFYKQDDSDQGTGLGLSICSVIAEKLNGRLELVSEVGKGSRFAILLPYGAQLNGVN